MLSCNGQPGPTHEVRYSPDGKDSVVHITYFDGRVFNDFYLHYVVFESLYKEGGYDKCFEYHTDHVLPVYWKRRYRTYEAKRN